MRNRLITALVGVAAIAVLAACATPRGETLAPLPEGSFAAYAPVESPAPIPLPEHTFEAYAPELEHLTPVPPFRFADVTLPGLDGLVP